ncbi:Metal regulatory transcription factor 1 [Chionoecetes opilio]|uniref:Metal regulatory transcription factor 1 n=1 Tax=Chionoecetes opilio TaxID=41210 RepID=A0A8J4XVF9_CHIOP|nr:Metal regulatory transcription factor 1 [Chionoecetes opilio]
MAYVVYGVVVNRYKRTISEVTQAPASPTIPHSEDADDDPNYDINEHYNKRGRGRGRSPGRPRLRGRGRGRPKGRAKPTDNISESCLVKLELEETLEEETFHKSLKTPQSLQTIKKEDIMSDLDSIEDSQENMVRIEALEEEEVEMEMPLDKDDVAMELQEDVLEVVEEVLEKEVQEGKRFSCSQCHKQFLTKAAIRNHIKVHDRLDSYECDECEKSFSTKYRLKAHLKIHVDRDRPHNCHAA